MLAEETPQLGSPALLLLIVTFGTLNVCLGFGLAMYFDYGPPGLDGIYQSLGPMPPASADAPLAAALGEPYVPFDTAPPQAVQPESPALSADASLGPPAVALPEEEVLGDVRALTAAAQSVMQSAAQQAQ
jgi:hypothetical protein